MMPAQREDRPILVANGTAATRDLVFRTLSARGYEVLLSQGAEALAAAKRRRPALVLAENGTSGENGLELLQAMRADPALNDVPVILVSDTPVDEVKLPGAGAVELLPTPLRAQELAARVALHIELAKTRAELARVRAEAQRVEARLRETEERIRIAQQAARWGVFDFDYATGRAYWSPELEQLYGLGAGAFPGTAEAWRSYLHPEDRAAAEDALRAAAETGEYAQDFRVVWPDGSVHWLFARAKVVRDAQNRPQRLLGVNVDITERKRAEHALRGRLEELQALMDVLPVGIFVAQDAACTHITTNRAAAAMLRLPAGANASKTGKDAATLPFRVMKGGEEMRPEDLPMQRAARTGQPIVGEEVKLVFAQGDTVTLYEYAIPLFDDAGRVRGCLGVFIDLTERKLAEERLRESEERYRSLVSVVTDVPWVTDATGCFSSPQQAWAAYTGQAWEQHRDRGWLEALHPDDRALVQGIWERPPTGPATYRAEVRLWHARSRRHRIVVARATPILDAAGGVRQWVGACTDVDDQKRAEETLERTVAERTAELRDTNEQLEAFVYSIAHDLRGPLRSMSGYSQLLLEDHAAALGEDGRHMLRRIQTSSEFMDKLVLDLIAYGRMARAAIELAPVPLARAWASAVFQCSAEIEQTGARVIAIEPLPVVLAHEATLGQCFANLLGNALKFVAEGVRPEIRCVAEVRGDRVRVWIEDNGLGIPVEHHDRVFRVFERLHGAQYSGTGIGLSIVRKGIERMGGSVGLESAPGQGSRFWIELARADPS